MTQSATEVRPVAAASGGGSIDPLVQDRPSRRRSRLSVVAAYFVTLFVLLTINFLLPRALPGDPLDAFAAPTSESYVQDDATRAALQGYYGLDRPLAVQYVDYLQDLARGDLGVSIRYGAPVTEIIKARLPWTLLLLSTALVLAGATGTLTGIHSGWARRQATNHGLLAVLVTVSNMPAFFVGSMALVVFAVKLRWLPLAGARSAFADLSAPAAIGDIALHLLLPALVLAIESVAVYFLMMRASMVAEAGADYLLLGRAKGLSDRRLKYAYAARNALLPVVTVFALQVGSAVTGAVLVERVFAYPGMGRLLFESVAFRDYPTLQGCFLVFTIAVVTINLLAELSYGRLDPRTR